MEDSWENWISHLEMDDEDFSNENSFDEQKILGEMLKEPEFSPERGRASPAICPSSIDVEGGAPSPTNSSLSFDDTITTTSFEEHGTSFNKSSSSNSIMSLLEKPRTTSPTTYILSFDKYASADEPAFNTIKHSPKSKLHDCDFGSLKRKVGNGSICFGKQRAEQEISKKIRRSSGEGAQDHIIAERKRRQELTGSIIKLAGTIPGLKKMDKAYVLREAVNYVKQLQKRVRELENQNDNKTVDSTFQIVKSQSFTPNCGTNSSDSGHTSIDAMFEVEARILQKDILIWIHCENQNDILQKILEFLGKHHLSMASCSALPFGTSKLVITIIAQMDDDNITRMDDLVKRLREEINSSQMTYKSEPC